MSAEVIIAGVAIAGVILTGAGQIMTWRKNGRELRERDVKMAKEQAARDTAINATQMNILSKLEDKETGLTAINRKVGDMQTHCAEVSTGLTERVRAAERDIKEGKESRSRSRRTS